jgi:hypothetical protein
MNKKFLITSLLLVFSIFFLFGCTESNLNICGDGVCTTGEENTCPTDCAEPVNATVNINVSGAYDATGDLSLYWHHSKDAYANASANITSRLGDNWFGEQSKNLNISFNDSESGSKPIGDERNIQMNFTEPGDYYFEVRSQDYEYRAVSEKITVSESKEYYVDLQIVPSNPALRVKAIDESGNIMVGEGKIDLYAIETVCKYGECTEDKWLYETVKFSAEDEMNALFFVYVPRDEYFNKRSINYEVVLSKTNYETSISWTNIYGKYQELQVILQKDVSTEKGDLKVSIVPGMGTTQDDLLELEGKEIHVWGKDKSIIGKVSKGLVYFEDLPYGSYYLESSYNKDFNYQSGIAPVSTESTQIEINQETNSVTVKGLLGIGLNLSIVDAKGNLIPKEEILQNSYCVLVDGKKECVDYEKPMPMHMNPVLSSILAYNEQTILGLEKQLITVNLEYNGVQQWFELQYKQGNNVFVWQFDHVATIRVE